MRVQKMETPILSQTISQFFTASNKNVSIGLKNLISPIICYAERNLNEVSYKKYGISDAFKEKFLFISQHLNDDELDEFIRFYKKIRALNVHAIAVYSTSKMKRHFKFDLSKLTAHYSFLRLNYNICGDDEELTIYGMLFVLSLLLNVDQFWAMLNTIIRQKSFMLPKEFLLYDTKKTFRDDFSALNTVKKEERDIPIIFCEEQYVVPIISETFLRFEEEVLKKHRIVPTKSYISFPEVMQPLDLGKKLKEELRSLRNMWAHGNCFYYTSHDDNTLIKFIEVMQLLATTQFEKIAKQGLKKLKFMLLNLKYKRPVEMAIKLQHDRLTEDGILHRLITMTNFRGKDDLVPLYIEKKLFEIDCGAITFGYNNKDEKLGTYAFSRITIIEHTTNENHPFIVEGFQTNLTYFKEFCLPEYPQLRVDVLGWSNKKERVDTVTEYVKKVTVVYGE